MKLQEITSRNIIYAAAVLLLINLAACRKLSSYDYPPSVGTAYEILKNDENFSTFYTVVNKAGLGDLLKGDQASTVYAPHNLAFKNAGYTSAVIDEMAVEDLVKLVKNHIVSGATDVNAVAVSQQQTTLSGLNITVEKVGDRFFVNGGDILNVSQQIVNGYLNVTSTVLVSRPTLNDVIRNYTGSGDAQFTYLAAAIDRASTGSTDFNSLLSGGAPYTLFAPTNGAFKDGGYSSIAAIQGADPEALADILKYHLIAGANLTTAFDSLPQTAFNGVPIHFDRKRRTVTTGTTLETNYSHWYANGIIFGNSVPSNLVADNGVMHSVSRFLPVPETVTTLDYIAADPDLSMFLALISRASQTDTGYNFESLLSEPDSSFTVFAITNDGLINEGYADIAAINNEEPVVLADLLKFHMLAQRVNNINIEEGGSVNSLLKSLDSNGEYTRNNPVSFLKNGGFAVQGASNANPIPVIEDNIITTNGLVNIIGSVLKP